MIIRKKEKRSALHAKLKHQKKKVEKRKKLNAGDAVENHALELVEEPPPKMIPRAIENTREADETVCKPNDEEEKLAAKHVSNSVEEGFDPTQVRATSGVNKRQLKGLDIHTHSEDVGVSASRQCPSRPSILSLEVQAQACKEEQRELWEQLHKLREDHAALLRSLQEKLGTKYASKGMEEGFDPTQVHGDLLLRATSGMKERQLKGLDVHTHSEDGGVSTSCPCPSKPSILQQSPQLLVQTSREELRKSQEHHAA